MGRCLKDYTGTIHGCWKVIERDWHPSSKSHETFWIAECQNCGHISSVRKTDLDKNPSSCNNCKGDFSNIAKSKKYDIKIGDQFGLLTVINKVKCKNNKRYFSCVCQCGKEIQVRKDHLLGLSHGKTISCGCANKSSGEIKIEQILKENNINFQTQYRIKEFNLLAPFDFAIFDDKNQLLKLIEFDGEQHFKAVEYFGGEEQLLIQQERDKKKNIWCKEHNIKLQRISYLDYDQIDSTMLLSDL